jgi:hypothetical protein
VDLTVKRLRIGRCQWRVPVSLLYPTSLALHQESHELTVLYPNAIQTCAMAFLE